MLKASQTRVTKAIDQITAGLLALKPVEDYLQQRLDLIKAFEVLAEKRAHAEANQGAVYKQMGAQEARRLLGQAGDEEASTQDSQLTRMREQSELLLSAETVLQERQKELDENFAGIYKLIQEEMLSLRQVFMPVLEEDLKIIAQKVFLFNCKYHVVKSVLGCYATSFNKLAELTLSQPSDNTILPTQAVVYRGPYSETQINWQADADAAALYKRLEPIQLLKQRLDRIEKEIPEELKA